MRHWFLFLVVWSGCQDISAQKITHDLETFSEIKAFDGLSINLIRSDVNRAVIDGDNTDKVAIVINDGVLKVRMEIDMIFSGYRTFVDLYHTDPLLVIDVNEDAKITCSGVVKQAVLELKAQEGGEIVMQADVEQLLIKAVTGGVISATGSSQNQDVMINTGGIYNGRDFRTKFSTVNVNAGSSAEIFATDYVKAMVKAGGEVLVYGDPARLEEKTVFGGRIKKM